MDELNRRVAGLTRDGENDQALKETSDLLAVNRKHFGKYSQDFHGSSTTFPMSFRQKAVQAGEAVAVQ